MKNTKKAVTLVEAIVTLAILALGLAAVYKTYQMSIRAIDGVGSKTQAIQIAREGIEAVENIRDTNWQIFPSNTKDCWNVLNYNGECITNTNITKISPITGTKTYILKKDIDPSTGTLLPENQKSGKWFLIEKTSSDNYDNETYKNTFKVKQNTNGLYFQGEGTDEGNPSFTGKNFTRKIEISEVTGTITDPIYYLDGTGTKKFDGKGIIVKSIVEWRDLSSSGIRKIVLENLMTNYKK